MGYEMYRLLSLKKSFVAGRKKKNKKTISPVVIDLDEEDRQQELLKGGRDEGVWQVKLIGSHCRMALKMSSSRYRESFGPARSRCGDL